MVSAEAVDETTVAVTLSQPTSIFLNTLASVGIVPEHAYGEDYGRSPIGSGPYKFVEWRPQEQIVFVANEDYYGGAPARSCLAYSTSVSMATSGLFQGMPSFSE